MYLPGATCIFTFHEKKHMFSPLTRRLMGLLIWIPLAACTKKGDSPATPSAKDTVFTATYQTAQLTQSMLFRLSDTFHLKTGALPELSGLVRASDTRSSEYWGEEDSGNKNAIYLLDTLGRLLGAKYLPVFNRDWEDMACGPGPENGRFYLYLGDIGDNLHLFPFITVYRFIAPSPDTALWTDSLISKFDALNFIYPDGPHDAEALMVDPLTKDIYVLTKEAKAGLYVGRYPQNTGEAGRLVKLGTLPISTVTAADITLDGNGIFIKNYDNIFYWTRKNGQSIASCLQQPPQRLAYQKEPQGESIALDPSGKGFFTISEKVGTSVQVLYHYVSR